MMASSSSLPVPSSLPPAKFWGLDGLMDSFPKFYIQDLVEIPEMSDYPGIFRYRDHPVSTVDILGVIVKVDKRDKVIIYAVDDGTGVISCCCFKSSYEMPSPATTAQLKAELSGGPLQSKLEMLISEKEQGSSGFSVGQLLSVRGVLQTFRNIREIKAYYHAIVKCPSAEIERMLQLPRLYRSIYDQPFHLPSQVVRETSSLAAGDSNFQMLSREVELLEKLTKLILAELDQKQLQTVSEQDLLNSIKDAVTATAKEPHLFKKALTNLEATGHLCRHPERTGEYMVIKYNQQLHRTVVEIISKHSGSDIGCHFTRIYEELRKLLMFSQLNKSSLWKCLALLEEQSDIISSTEQHFIVYS